MRGVRYMDDLVMVGAAGILGLVLVAVLGAVVLIWAVHHFLTAFLAGDWGSVGQIVAAILAVAALYIGTGLWLKKTGHI